MSPSPMTVQQLLDSNRLAVKMFYSLKPTKGQQEYEHFKLISDIRDYYLRYQAIEKQANEESFTAAQTASAVQELKDLLAGSSALDDRFAKLNKGYINPSQIEEENQLRNAKVIILYDRLSRKK